MNTFIALSIALQFADTDMTKMGPWTRPVNKKDDKGIDALYKACEDAMKKGDINALADMNDYPVFMATDDAAGKYTGSEWTKDKWIAEMKPMFSTPMPKDMKHTVKKSVHFNSETVATVIEDHSQTMGKTTSKWTSTSVVVLKEGKWLFKQMFEAGWGNAGDTASAKK